MNQEFNPDALTSIELLNSHGYLAYIVGGAIRDYFLHCDSTDYDVTTSANLEEICKVFEGYKTKQTARTSAEYAEVKPKFFDRVYDLVDRADGAKPVKDQLADLKKDYEEYFISPQAADPAPKFPQFGAKPEGAMPKGDEGAVAAFKDAWGFTPKKS